MATQCTPAQLEFHALGRRGVVGRFDGGRLTSDAGGVLLREVDRRLALLDRVARCFADFRHPGKIEHALPELVAQRIYGIALGYEDVNDHDALRADSLLALLAGKADPTGAARARARDRGHALAGSSTLNRLELGAPEAAAKHRYKKTVADPAALDRLLVDVFLESRARAPEEIWLDLDATDDPVHGDQEGRFFHGYYGRYCYLPLYIFCGGHLLCARLRPSDIDAAEGAAEELDRIVKRIRGRWPGTRVVIRGDAGFCREEIMAWCEANEVGHVLGLARNPRLVRRIGKALRKSRRRCAHTGEASRRFRQFRYRTRDSWSRTRRVVAKAEQLDMFADRTSAATLRANQLRLYFASFAYVLMHGLRRLGLAGTRRANAQCGTLRTRLLKVAARLRVTARKVWLSFSSVYPHQSEFAAALAAPRRVPARAPPD